MCLEGLLYQISILWLGMGPKFSKLFNPPLPLKYNSLRFVLEKTNGIYKLSPSNWICKRLLSSLYSQVRLLIFRLCRMNIHMAFLCCVISFVLKHHYITMSKCSPGVKHAYESLSFVLEKTSGIYKLSPLNRICKGLLCSVYSQVRFLIVLLCKMKHSYGFSLLCDFICSLTSLHYYVQVFARC